MTDRVRHSECEIRQPRLDVRFLNAIQTFLMVRNESNIAAAEVVTTSRR